MGNIKKGRERCPKCKLMFQRILYSFYVAREDISDYEAGRQETLKELTEATKKRVLTKAMENTELLSLECEDGYSIVQQKHIIAFTAHIATPYASLKEFDKLNPWK